MGMSRRDEPLVLAQRVLTDLRREVNAGAIIGYRATTDSELSVLPNMEAATQWWNDNVSPDVTLYIALYNKDGVDVRLVYPFRELLPFRESSPYAVKYGYAPRTEEAREIANSYVGSALLPARRVNPNSFIGVRLTRHGWEVSEFGSATSLAEWWNHQVSNVYVTYAAMFANLPDGGPLIPTREWSRN